MRGKMHIVHNGVKRINAHSAFARVTHQMHDLHMDIARFRRDRGLSQRDLAEMIGCDQSTVQRAETMHKSAKLTTYLEYANALNVQLSDLFSEDVTPVEVEILRIFRRVPKEKHGYLMSLLQIAREGGDEEAEGSSSFDSRSTDATH